MASPMQTGIPEGWTLKEHVKRDGTTVKCYTNVLGQEFYTYNDLMRYVNYAKNAKLSIYSPPPVAAKEKNLAEIEAEKQNLEDQPEFYHQSSDADLSSGMTAEIAAGMQRLGSHAQCYYNQNLPRDKTAEIAAGKQQLEDHAQSYTRNLPRDKTAEKAAGKQQLEDHAQSHTQSEEMTRSRMLEVVKPLTAEASEKSNLVLAPVVDAPARRASKRIAGLKPKPEPGSSTSKHERRRRASRRLAGLEPDCVPGNGK